MVICREAIEKEHSAKHTGFLSVTCGNLLPTSGPYPLSSLLPFALSVLGPLFPQLPAPPHHLLQVPAHSPLSEMPFLAVAPNHSCITLSASLCFRKPTKKSKIVFFYLFPSLQSSVPSTSLSAPREERICSTPHGPLSTQNSARLTVSPEKVTSPHTRPLGLLENQFPQPT